MPKPPARKIVKEQVCNVAKPLVPLLVPIESVAPDPHNARLHPEANIRAIRVSLEAYGQRKPIVVNGETGIIEAGSGLWQAAIELGWTHIAAVRVDDDPSMATGYALMDNQSALLAEWDYAALKDLLEGLDTGAFDMDLTGFDGRAIEDLMTQFHVSEEGMTDDDEIPEAPEPICKLGDLWRLGNHRLLCGDATKKEDMERLMGGEKADMVWTDPPYGVKYGEKLERANPIAHRVRSISGDNLPPDKLREFLNSTLSNMAEVSKQGIPIYVACPAGTPLPISISAFVGSGFDFHWQLVWVKDQLVLSRADYHFRHENILYGWKSDAGHYFTDDRTQDSIFEISRPKSSEEHPTMKPVELIEQMLKNSSKIGQGILDPFLGSGSTLIACEKLGRRCYGVEIEPHYCDVIIQRWGNYTGKKAIKL